MAACPHCGHINRPGELFCDECAREIYQSSDKFASTRQLYDDAAPEIITSNLANPAYFGLNDSLVIHIRDEATPIVIMPGIRQLVLGRTSSKSARIPEIDLTPFNALDKGVSHIHATLSQNGESLMLTDKGSVNGTFINGQRLIANRPYMLRDGDEVRLARLVLHAYFQKQLA